MHRCFQIHVLPTSTQDTRASSTLLRHLQKPYTFLSTRCSLSIAVLIKPSLYLHSGPQPIQWSRFCSAKSWRTSQHTQRRDILRAPKHASSMTISKYASAGNCYWRVFNETIRKSSTDIPAVHMVFSVAIHACVVSPPTRSKTKWSPFQSSSVISVVYRATQFGHCATPVQYVLNAHGSLTAVGGADLQENVNVSPVSTRTMQKSDIIASAFQGASPNFVWVARLGTSPTKRKQYANIGGLCNKHQTAN